MKELKLLFKVAPKTLLYGFLAKRHADKAIKYGNKYPSALAYHRDMAHYYYHVAFGEKPKL